MSVVLTTSPGFGRAGDLPRRIGKLGWEVVRRPDGASPEDLARADILVAGLPPVGEGEMEAAPRLRGIVKHGVGLDSVDLAAATRRGVPVTSTPGANAAAVAELALAALLALSRNLVEGHRTIVGGGWERRVGREVEGMTLGIVGLGAIGRTLGRKALALGMTVLATDPAPDRIFAGAHGIELLPLTDLLRRSDAVSLHVAGSAKMIGAAELSVMRADAVLMNFARGEVVDLDALAQALAADRLGGAAIDAYPQEPPDRSGSIFSAPRVLFSPHSGADTTGSLLRMGEMVIEDVTTLLAGGRPARTVNPDCYRTGRTPA